MLVSFDVKEKIKALKIKGKKSPKEYFDLGVAFWLINPDEKDYSPENLSQRYLHKEYLRTEKGNIELYKFAEKKIKEYGLKKVFYEIEMPLLDVLADMETIGIKIDVKYLKSFERELDKKLEKLVKVIYKEAGEIFNINSPKQLGNILFNKLKIDFGGVKKTRGGSISTDVETLDSLKGKHKIIQSVLEYREIFKLKTTYVAPLGELADKNNRVHTDYIQTGTATGRLSSQNPNLQNVPIGTELALKFRKSFVAEKGYKIIAFDYSQIELRVLASLSSDPKMIEAFENDLDIHKMTAANVFNVSLEKVTPEMRRLGKTLNFGVVYGMGAMAFARSSKLSFSEAKKFIEEYFSDFKNIKEWQEEVKKQARATGYVTNLNGRRRLTLETISFNSREAAGAERMAINMPVQGLAADIIKIAMIKIADELKKRGWWQKDARMLLTIHDELLFEIKDNIIKEAEKFIIDIMESACELKVPIKVSVKMGENWSYE